MKEQELRHHDLEDVLLGLMVSPRPSLARPEGQICSWSISAQLKVLVFLVC